MFSGSALPATSASISLSLKPFGGTSALANAVRLPRRTIGGEQSRKYRHMESPGNAAPILGRASYRRGIILVSFLRCQSNAGSNLNSTSTVCRRHVVTAVVRAQLPRQRTNKKVGAE